MIMSLNLVVYLGNVCIVDRPPRDSIYLDFSKAFDRLQ